MRILDLQNLIESYDDRLYHGTSIVNLKKILQKNELRAQKSVIGMKNVVPSVSFSRSLSTAAKYVSTIRRSGPFVLELDRRLLSHNYRIEPFNYHGFERDKATKTLVPSASGFSRFLRDSGTEINESEERILRDVENLSRYLMKIHIYDEDALRDLSNEYLTDEVVKNHPLLYYKGVFINAGK